MMRSNIIHATMFLTKEINTFNVLTFMQVSTDKKYQNFQCFKIYISKYRKK